MEHSTHTKLEEHEINATTYSLTIRNESGEVQNIALYQEYPDQVGRPVVWFQKKIGPDNTDQFEWDINWELTWGTTEAELAPGVTFKSWGKQYPVDPTPTQNNSIVIGYKDDDFNASVLRNTTLATGQLSVQTTNEFTVDQAKYMQVVVCMFSKPAFAMHGKPNGSYLITTKPQYYIAVTDAKSGTVISAQYVSSPTLIQYSGVTSLSYILDNTLTFKPQQSKLEQSLMMINSALSLEDLRQQATAATGQIVEIRALKTGKVQCSSEDAQNLVLKYIKINPKIRAEKDHQQIVQAIENFVKTHEKMVDSNNKLQETNINIIVLAFMEWISNNLSKYITVTGFEGNVEAGYNLTFYPANL